MKKTNSKKTTSMRVAAAMLALTLITSCFAGGTFAKFTTSASGGDSARVAKFGVEIDAGASTFLDKYETDDTTYTGQYSVQSADGKKVVAPGTSGEMDLFSISGTPEVAVRINAEMSDVESIFLKTNPVIRFTLVDVEGWKLAEETELNVGTGGSTTTTPPSSQEELERLYNKYEDMLNDSWGSSIDSNPIEKTEIPGSEYYPIKWTLKQNGTAVANGTLADVKDYIDKNINGVECAPNTDLATIGGAYTLAWEWAYEDGNDEQDTALGNFAAGITDSSYNAHNLTEAFNFSVTVTQID